MCFVHKPNLTISMVLAQHKIENWTRRKLAHKDYMFQHICGMPRHTFSTFYMDIGLVLTLKFCLVGTCFHPEMIAESPLCDSIFSFIYIYLSFAQSYVQMRYDTSHDGTMEATVWLTHTDTCRNPKYWMYYWKLLESLCKPECAFYDGNLSFN